MYDAVIIGAGHNGLAAAFYLARAGRRPLVLERRPWTGGGAVSTEIHPGFRAPALSHEILLDEQIVRDLDLKNGGAGFLAGSSLICSPSLDGPALVLNADSPVASGSLRIPGTKDADAFRAFRSAVERAAAVVAATFQSPPPDIDTPGASDLWSLFKAGHRFRSLGTREGHQLLRWLSMPIGDLVGEWFDNELLRATVAGPGLSGTMLAPRSAGGAFVMLLREASRLRAGGRSLRPRGGPGTLMQAMAAAATRAGAEIRTGVNVDRILVRDGRVAGVVANGEEIPCTTVASGADPKTTLLSLVDPVHLEPDFVVRVRNYRAAGTVAKVNLALSSLPRFGGVDDDRVLEGRIHIGPTLDYLERAFDHVKYGEVSAEPWLDVTIPSLADETLAPSGAHVASIYVHCAPYRLRGLDWPTANGLVLERTLAVLEAYAPQVRSQIVAAQVFSPADLERDLGLSGGHIFHGELALDQIFTMRPLLGQAGFDTPIQGLYLCGAGTHPGGFMTGMSGRLAAGVIVKNTRAR